MKFKYTEDDGVFAEEKIQFCSTESQLLLRSGMFMLSQKLLWLHTNTKKDDGNFGQKTDGVRKMTHNSKLKS